MATTPPAPDEVLSRDVSERQESGATYLDVRTAEEFELGHVPGAYNVPWQLGTLSGMVANPDFDRVMTTAFEPDATLIIGCRSGKRAGAAAERLRALGFDNLAVHRESWSGYADAFGRTSPSWQSLGLPIETTPMSGRSYAELQGDDSTRDDSTSDANTSDDSTSNDGSK